MNGGINDQTSQADSGEANLDQQYVLAVGFDTPVTEFSVGGLGQLVPDGESPTQEGNSNEPFLEWLIALSAMDNSQIPNSISVSYGENEQEIPLTYATQVCNMFAQLGARGKSVMIASGDSGVGSFCQANDGTNAPKFQPQFPASCPYVTAVGGVSSLQTESKGIDLKRAQRADVHVDTRHLAGDSHILLLGRLLERLAAPCVPRASRVRLPADDSRAKLHGDVQRHGPGLPRRRRAVRQLPRHRQGEGQRRAGHLGRGADFQWDRDAAQLGTPAGRPAHDGVPQPVAVLERLGCHERCRDGGVDRLRRAGAVPWAAEREPGHRWGQLGGCSRLGCCYWAG